MKLQIWMSCVALSAASSLMAQQFQFTTKQPQAGKKVSFTYSPVGGPLEKEANIDFTAYSFNRSKNKFLAHDVEVAKKGNQYTGSFKSDTGARIVMVVPEVGEKKDNNQKKGFYSPVYDSKGKLRTEVVYNEATIWEGFGEALAGIPSDMNKSFELLQQAWKTASVSEKNAMLGGYIMTLNRVKKKEAKPEVLAILDELSSSPSATETVMNISVEWYKRMGETEKSAALEKKMKEAYPNGSWKNTEKFRSFMTQSDFDKKLEIYQSLLQDPAIFTKEQGLQEYMLSNLAQMAVNSKKENKWEIFQNIANQLKPSERYSLYNNIAWDLSYKKDTLIDKAFSLSNEATKWAEQQMNQPSEPKPEEMTSRTWVKVRKQTFAMYADTYAWVLYKQGKYEEGLKYAKAGSELKEWKDGEYNDRYVQLASKVLSQENMLAELERIAKLGGIGKEGKQQLLKLLTNSLGSEQLAEQRLKELTASGKEKMRIELAKKMIQEAAPQFSLKDLTGKTVSLASLEGKVVVVDFWATWCGPCIQSFPGMQQAQNELSNQSDVVFLFVNTWESQATQEARDKEVRELLKKSNYTFQVLYDEKGENDEYQVVSKFKVEGIPTKFIIDKKGQIRFKSVGYGGNQDALVEELKAMVELAK